MSGSVGYIEAVSEKRSLLRIEGAAIRAYKTWRPISFALWYGLVIIFPFVLLITSLPEDNMNADETKGLAVLAFLLFTFIGIVGARIIGVRKGAVHIDDKALWWMPKSRVDRARPVVYFEGMRWYMTTRSVYSNFVPVWWTRITVNLRFKILTGEESKATFTFKSEDDYEEFVMRLDRAIHRSRLGNHISAEEEERLSIREKSWLEGPWKKVLGFGFLFFGVALISVVLYSHFRLGEPRYTRKGVVTGILFLVAGANILAVKR